MHSLYFIPNDTVLLYTNLQAPKESEPKESGVFYL